MNSSVGRKLTTENWVNCGNPVARRRHGNPQPSSRLMPLEGSETKRPVPEARRRVWQLDSPRQGETSGARVISRLEVRILAGELPRKASWIDGFLRAP